LYGTYPEVIAQPGTKAKIEAITEISESNLMKDILELNQVRHALLRGSGLPGCAYDQTDGLDPIGPVRHGRRAYR
jgi:hypothetical protein